MSIDINKKAIYKRYIRLVLYWIVAVVLAGVFLFQPIMLISKSFMSNPDSRAIPALFFPKEFSVQGYINAMDPLFVKYMWNTVKVLVLSSSGIALSSLWTAYAFAKLEWKGKNVVFMCILSTTFLPGMVLTIPSYVIYIKVFNWTNTLKPLWVACWFGGGALTIFLLRQYMMGLPREMDEASVIDGANTFQHFFAIIVPLCKPMIAYQVLGAIMGVWNGFEGPLIYIQDPDLYTIPVGLFIKFQQVDYAGTMFPNTKMATGVILMIPLLILFACAQQTLIDGVRVGVSKG